MSGANLFVLQNLGEVVLNPPTLQSRKVQRPPPPRILLIPRRSDVHLNLHAILVEFPHRHNAKCSPFTGSQNKSAGMKQFLRDLTENKEGVSTSRRDTSWQALSAILPTPFPSLHPFCFNPAEFQIPSHWSLKLHYLIPTEGLPVPGLTLFQGRSTVLFLAQRPSVPASFLLVSACLLGC